MAARAGADPPPPTTNARRNIRPLKWDSPARPVLLPESRNRGLSVLSDIRGAADLRSAEFTVSEENSVPLFPLNFKPHQKRLRTGSFHGAQKNWSQRISVKEKKKSKLRAICYYQRTLSGAFLGTPRPSLLPLAPSFPLNRRE